MNVYIFLGPELGKKQDAMNSLRKKFPDAEETVFYAGETDAGFIADNVQNGSLFSESRIVLVKNADLIKKKDDIELLAGCAKKMGADTALVFFSEEIKLAAALDDLAPKANRQVFYELFEREKSEWLRSFFRKEGFNIEPPAVDTILEMVENNTEAFRKECSRLILFLPKDRPISASDIEKWLAHSREETAFSLFSRIAAGDISKSLESLRSMLAAKESPQGILAALAWCWRKLADYIDLAEGGNGGNNFELKKIGLSSPKAREDYIAAAGRYGASDALACLAITAEYDILLRSPLASLESVLMDRYIIAIFNAATGK
ncbi:MAG: DNA polymerase III subunit delta [Spirochaetes bacterium]|nr:DNA polymerase III subunit delta [Spirochaetota bacterium]